MPDVAILASAVQATPNGYTLPGGQEIVVKSVRASYDGTGAAAPFVPTLQLVAPGGVVVSEWPLDVTLSAGATADITWFPRVGGSTGTNVIYSEMLAAPAASFSIPAIPQTYTHLDIQTMLRSDSTSSSQEAGNLVCNGASQYYEQEVIVGLGNNVVFEATTVTGSPNEYLEALTNHYDAEHYGVQSTRALFYSASTSDHSFVGLAGSIPTTGTNSTWRALYRYMQFCQIGPELPITSLTITPVLGANWMAGSWVTITGVP